MEVRCSTIRDNMAWIEVGRFIDLIEKEVYIITGGGRRIPYYSVDISRHYFAVDEPVRLPGGYVEVVQSHRFHVKKLGTFDVETPGGRRLYGAYIIDAIVEPGSYPGDPDVIVEHKGSMVCVGGDEREVLKRIGAPDVVMDISIYGPKLYVEFVDLRRTPRITEIREASIENRGVDACGIYRHLAEKGLVDGGEADVTAVIWPSYESVYSLRTVCRT